MLTISRRAASVKGSAQPAVRVGSSFDADYPDGDRLSTEVFLNIGMLTGAVRSAVEDLVTQAGLPSLAAFNVLSVVAGDPAPLRPSVIASRMMVTRATITGLLDSLERRCLVRRVQSTDDGRTRLVLISPAGRRIANQLLPHIHRFERQLMAPLRRHELESLLDMVARLQEHVVDLAPGATPHIDA